MHLKSSLEPIMETAEWPPKPAPRKPKEWGTVTAPVTGTPWTLVWTSDGREAIQ